MYTTIFLPFFLRHLRVCELLCCTAFRWDKGRKRLVRVKGWWRIGLFRVQALLHLIYQVAMVHQLIFGKVPIPMKLQGLVFFTIYLILLTARWNWKLDNSPIQVLNSFLDFEDTIPDFIKAEKSFEDKMLTLYLHVLQASIPMFPVLNLIVLSNNPCSLPFMGSMSPYCEGGVWSHPSHITWLAMLLVETWMGYQIFFAGTCWILYIFFVGTVCILDYLHYVEKMIKRIKTPKDGGFAPSGMISDQEVLAGDASRAMIDGDEGPLEVRLDSARKRHIKEAKHEACVLIYRTIQVLERMFNVFLKARIVPGMVSCLPGIQIFSQYVCIKLHSEIPMPGFLVFPTVLLDAVLNNILMFTLASIVNTFSRNILSNWRKDLDGFKRGAGIKRQLKGCAQMKIQFGSNFIDNGTPLVIQDFCTSQTMSLLLVKSKHKQ